jgi:hypothetical protein
MPGTVHGAADTAQLHQNKALAQALVDPAECFYVEPPLAIFRPVGVCSRASLDN